MLYDYTSTSIKLGRLTLDAREHGRRLRQNSSGRDAIATQRGEIPIVFRDAEQV